MGNMKKISLAGFGAWCVVIFFTLISTALASDNVKLYLEGEVGASFMKVDSGGYNTIGSFGNTGDDSATQVVPGLRFGAQLFNFMRADMSFDYRGKTNYNTNSLPPMLYETEISDVYSLMFSVFAEPFHFNNFTPDLGVGIGSTWLHVKTHDGVVQTDSSDTRFSWQIEAGVSYAFTDNMAVRVGYRYIDMGKFDVPLSHMGTGAAAGNYTGSLTAHEVMASFRYTF